MEPERKIEKMLRAYAKKRRDEANDAFTLHSATRRRLQGELDKQFAEPSEEESVSLWQLFRQQWAVLAGFALVIFFVATMFLPSLSKAKMKAQSASAMSNLKQIGLAAQIVAVDNSGWLPATLDELTNNHLLSAKVLTDPMSGKRFVFAAGGEKLDALASNAVLAYSPEDKKSRAVLLADGSVQMMSQKQFGDLEQSKLKAPVTPTEVASGTSALMGVNNNSQKFRNTVANTMPVLVSFELQQNGNNLAVVDADGSVYQGSLQTNGPIPKSPTPVVVLPAMQNQISTVAKNENVVGNNFYFRVSGQNRTSKQNVVFTGNLIPLVGNTVNSQADSTTNNSAGGGETPQAQNAKLFSKSRIAGTAMVDTTNQIDVNAMPTTP